MAQKKLQATATLFLDTSNAQSDAKKFVNDIKQKLAEVETAADKMSVFKDVVGYIAQIDRALTALKAKNADVFNSAFGSLDVDLKRQLEGIFGIDGVKLGQLDVLREKLNNLTPKSSIDEIRNFAKTMNNVFESIGLDIPFPDIKETFAEFNKEAKAGHIETLKTKLLEFATVWEDVTTRMSGGFGVGGSSAGGIASSIEEQRKAIQGEIDRLREQKDEYQELLDVINGKNVKVKTSKKTDVEQLQELINKFNEAQGAVKDFEKANNTSGDGYRQALAEAYKMAVLLKNTMDYVSELGSDAGASLVAKNLGTGGAYSEAEKLLNNFKNSSQFDDVLSHLKQKIEDVGMAIEAQYDKFQKLNNPGDADKAISLYDQLYQKAKEYLEIRRRINEVDKVGNPDLYRNLSKESTRISSEIEQLKPLDEDMEDLLYDVFDEANQDGAQLSTIVEKLCNIFQVEIPQAASQASTATGTVFSQITDDAIKAGEGVSTFGKKIINISEYVTALSGQLKEMFAATGRSANFEYHIAIDGLDIKARHGSEKSVDLATQTGTYLDTLFSDSAIYGHSHRGGTAATNIQDIESVLSSYRDGVSVPVHFVVGKDAITTIDFTGLSKDMVDKLKKEIAATNNNKEAPVQNEVINKIVEKFTGKSSALKTWNVTQFDDLAKYLYDVSEAASSALTPIEKFQAVLDNMFGKGRVDASKYESLLPGLNKDNAKSIFNRIASAEKLPTIDQKDMLTMGQVNAEIDESIAKYKTLREEANLSYSDIRKEVDKVIEHYESGGSATSGLDFFKQYFPEGEWQNVRNLLTDAYDGLISIEEVTNRIANEFAVDSDTFAKIPNGIKTLQDDNVKAKLEEFLALADKMQHENLYGSAENNVDIGRYIERLEIAKTELEALGAQGLITAEDLEKVNIAFAGAKSHLEDETSHYDSFYSGPSYDYYDEYKEQQERAETAEGENTRLQRQIETMRQLSDIDKQIGLTQNNNVDELDGLIEDRKALLDMAESTNSLSEQDLQTQRAITQEYEERSKFIHDGYDKAERDFNLELSYLNSEDFSKFSIDDINGYIDRLDVLYAKLQEAYNNNLMGDADTFFENIEGPYTKAISSLENAKMNLDITPQIEDATKKVGAFYKLATEISHGTMSASFDDVEIGKYMARLEDARAELERFNKDQLITAETMEDVNRAFNIAQTELSEAKLTNRLNIIEGYVSEENLRASEKEAEKLYDELRDERERANQLAGDLAIAEDRVRTAEAKMYEADEKAGQYKNILDADSQFKSEAAQLEILQQKLLEVKTAVDAKTQAFEEEYVTVDGVVDAEIVSLQELINKLLEVSSQIGLIENGLRNINSNSVNLNVSDSEEQLASLLTSSDITSEMSQLEQLQNQVVVVKNAVISKTKSFVDEGNVVGQVVGKEIAALKNLSVIVDSIAPKVKELVDGLKKIDAAKLNGTIPEVNNGSNVETPVQDPFKAKLTAQKGAFTKYVTDIKEVDYLTEDLEKQLDSLRVSLGEVTDQSGLDDWVKRFNNLKEIVKAVKSEFEQINLGTVNVFQKELTNSFNKLTLPQKEEMLKEYFQAIILLNQQKQAVQEGHAVELEGIKKITEALQEKINAQIEANKAAKAAATAQKKNGNFGSTASINATAKYNSLSKVASSGQFANSSEVAAIMTQYEQAYKHMMRVRDEVRNKDVIDDSDREAFKQATTECNNYASALDKLVKSTMKLKGAKANPDDYMLGSDFDYSNIEQRKAALEEFVQQTYGLKVAAEDFEDGWNKVVFAVDNGDGTFTQMTATFTDARNEIVALAGDTKKVQTAFQSFIDGFKGRVKSLAQYFLATVSIYDVLRVAKQGAQYVKEIDSALTELKKVTDETDASYNQFLQDMSKTGSVIGATVKDLTLMASEWARLGYSMEEAGKLAESTAILMNVSEFDDATKASEALISTMQAFQYTADESGHVVDVLNEVGEFIAHR